MHHISGEEDQDNCIARLVHVGDWSSEASDASVTAGYKTLQHTLHQHALQPTLQLVLQLTLQSTLQQAFKKDDLMARLVHVGDMGCDSRHVPVADG